MRKHLLPLIGTVTLLVGLGVVLLLGSRAASPYASQESESGTTGGTGISKLTDSSASSGQFVQFGTASSGTVRPPAEHILNFDNGQIGCDIQTSGGSNTIGLQSSIVRYGAGALKEIDYADSKSDGTMRSHCHAHSAGNDFTQSTGATKWFANSVYIPSGNGNVSDWWCILEWYGGDNSGAWNGSPPIALDATNTQLYFQASPVDGPLGTTYINLGSMNYSPNTWYDFVWQIKFSRDTDGFLKVWAAAKGQPLQQLVNWTGPTMHGPVDGTKPNAQTQIYPLINNYSSDKNGTPLTVYHDEIRLGNSQESVLQPDR